MASSSPETWKGGEKRESFKQPVTNVFVESYWLGGGQHDNWSDIWDALYLRYILESKLGRGQISGFDGSITNNLIFPNQSVTQWIFKIASSYFNTWNAIFGERILFLEKNIFALKVETILLKKNLCKIEGKLPFFKRQLFLRLWHKNILYWQFSLAIKKTLLYRFDRLHDWFAYNQIDFSFIFYKNKSLFLKNHLQIIYLYKSNNQKYFSFTLWHYKYHIPFFCFYISTAIL